MKKHTTLFFTILILTIACNSIYQNDFVKSERIAQIEEIEIIYNLFQTGTDNYRYEFMVSKNNDTIRLFDSYLNDASSKNSFFTIENSKEMIEIISNKPLGTFEKKALGITFILRGIK